MAPSRSSSASSPSPPRRCAPTRGCAPSFHKGVLPQATRERIALAVAEHRGDDYSIAQYSRTARAAGLGLDEVARAREFKSSDEKEQLLLTLLEETLTADGTPQTYMVEEAREAGWTDAEIIEAIAELALSEFQSLFARAGELPLESSDPAILRSAA